MEYQACLDIIKENLALGVNVVAPGPWTKEIKNNSLFSIKDLGLPEDTKLSHVFIDKNPKKVRNIIEKRARPEDKWKIENWESFEKTLIIPENIMKQQVHIFKDESDAVEQVNFLLNEMRL